MTQYSDFKTNYFFPTITRYLGYIIIIIGLIGVFTRGYESLLISAVGIGLSFTRLGVLFDKENKKLKEYTNVFWFKLGKWESSMHYPFITVLEISEKNSMYSKANVEYASKELVFRITLLNENHRIKILLKQLKNKDNAHDETVTISRELDLKKVIYSPK